ncbi:MAG: NUDIX domain-containing protein [Candidatus Spechtbacterales bacterium]
MKDQSFGIIPFTKEGGTYKFLIVQHLSANGGGAHWSFPKGHKEKGETDLGAALREFKEETGIQNVEIVDEKGIAEKYFFNREGEDINKTVKYFLGFINHSQIIKIQKEELYNYKWATFDEVMESITFDEAKDVLKRAYSHIAKTYDTRHNK